MGIVDFLCRGHAETMLERSCWKGHVGKAVFERLCLKGRVGKGLLEKACWTAMSKSTLLWP